MKTAIKVLVIIAFVIGVIWSIVGFFGVWFGGAIVASGQEVFEEDSEAAAETTEATATIMLKMIGSFLVIIAGFIFGLISCGKEVKKATSITMGVLLIICGVLAIIWTSYVAGPLYILSGILASISGSSAKPLTAE